MYKSKDLLVRHTLPYSSKPLEETPLYPNRTENFKTLIALWKEMEMHKIFQDGIKSIDRDKQILDFIEFHRNLMVSIPVSEILYFIDLQKNAHDRKNGKDMSNGQIPSLIYLSSTSLINPFDIFCSSKYEKIANGLVTGGVYGTANGIHNLKQLDEASDLTVVMYMLNQLLKNRVNIGECVAPYIPCIGDFDPKSSIGFEDVAKIQIKRLEKLKGKLRLAGRKITEKGDISYLKFHNVEFALLPLVYNVETREFYIIKNGNSQDFVTFMNNNGYAKNKIVQNHIKNLLEHKKNTYATKLREYYETYKNYMCVDSRQNPFVGGAIQVIGAYPREDELKRTIQNADIKILNMQLHTNCGYINLGIDISKLFDEIQKSALCTETGVWTRLNGIMTNTGSPLMCVSNEIEEITSALNLKGNSALLFKELFLGKRLEDGSIVWDSQRAFKHMRDRKLIVGDTTNGFVFGPVEQVKKDLGTVSVTPAEFAYLVTEQMARDILEKAERIKKETGIQKEIHVYIESLTDHKLYEVPSKLYEFRIFPR